MIGKIVQGADFRGVVNYVLQKPDAEPLGGRGLRNDSIDHIVDSFRMQASLNPIVKPVAHISLDFSVQDKARLTNKMMMQIADEYLRRMGYGDTQVLIVRHHDREHPHLHLVLNRIDGNGKRISDKNERVRNAKVCRELSDKYGLYIAPNKDNVKRHRLREPDKTKYEIYDAIRECLPKCRNWNDLALSLRKHGIETEFKYKGSTSTIEGVKFSKNGYTFSGSKVDKAFSCSKLNRHFTQARQRVPQQPSLGKRMMAVANNYRSVFSGLFGNNPSVTQGVDMGAYGIIALPPFDFPIKLSAAQLQRRVGESPEEHLARVAALLNMVAEAMAVAAEEHKRRLRDMKPKKSILKFNTMNENKMMSYEMYEELKSTIVKTIKTEITNAKLMNTTPNDFSQQIEQAVLRGLAQCGTTLDVINESITITAERQSEVLAEVKNLRDAVSAIEIPKELPPRWHNHRHILGSDSKTLTVFFVTCFVIIVFMSIALWDARQPNVQRDDNDLKYRYMKMKDDISPELIAELEDIFTINRDLNRIKQMRSDVEEYEQTILRQAALAEQARLKAQEAEQFKDKAKKLKNK